MERVIVSRMRYVTGSVVGWVRNAGNGVDEALLIYQVCMYLYWWSLLKPSWTDFVIFLRVLTVDETAQHVDCKVWVLKGFADVELLERRKLRQFYQRNIPLPYTKPRLSAISAPALATNLLQLNICCLKFDILSDFWSLIPFLRQCLNVVLVYFKYLRKNRTYRRHVIHEIWFWTISIFIQTIFILSLQSAYTYYKSVNIVT